MTEVQTDRVAQLETELRDLKRKVIDTARVYAQRHDLCAVVDQALAEAGLTDTDEYEITLNIPTTIKLQVNPDRLGILAEAEREKYVAQQVAPALLTLVDKTKIANLLSTRRIGTSGRAVPTPDPVVTFGAITLPDGTTLDGPVARPGRDGQLPEGYIARYNSIRGRAMHVYLEHQYNQVYDDHWIYSLCQRTSDMKQSLTENSPRGEDRFCAACADRMRSRGVTL